MTDFSDAFINQEGDQQKYFSGRANAEDIKGIFTSCEECVFSVYENNTQISCKLDRIEKFKSKNAEVIEACSDEKEFYVIKSFCNCYRNAEWGDNHVDHESCLEKENRIRWNAIIVAGGGKSESEMTEKNVSSFLKDLEKTCISIKEQSIPPVAVVVSNNSDVPPFDVSHKAHEMFDRTGIDFFVSNIVEPNFTDLECIDDAFLKCKNGYYSVFKSGHALKPDLFASLNNAINNELEKVALIRGYDGINGLTVQASMHKYLGGNFSMSIEEKIHKICEEDGSNNITRDWEELDEFS
jgi:hypothetical protein